MPTYGYRCQACGTELERFQKISDPALTTCEDCGGALKKLLYPVGISFKGSGFYVNDYSKSGGGTKSSESSGESGSSSTESKTETKSETKTDSGTSSVPAATPSSTPSTNS